MKKNQNERKSITELDVAMILLVILLDLGLLGFLSVIPKEFWLAVCLVLLCYGFYKLSEAIEEKKKEKQRMEEDSGKQEPKVVRPAENGSGEQKTGEAQPGDGQDRLLP